MGEFAAPWPFDKRLCRREKKWRQEARPAAENHGIILPGIDATVKLKGEAGYQREWPPIVKMDPAVKEEVGRKWAELLGRLGGSSGNK